MKAESKLGRRRDPTRELDLMEAACEILAEVGFEGMTMDMVADRAKAGKATMYRRWTSKTELILAAVQHMKSSMVDPENLPDTGSLRGDLVALVKPQAPGASETKVKIMRGLLSVLGQNPKLADAVDDMMVEFWARTHLALMTRAQERKEISASVDVAILSRVVPTMVAYRALILQKPFDKEYLFRLIDQVLMPAAGIAKR